MEDAVNLLNQRFFEKTGKKLFLPVHRGPDLNDAGKDLVNSGDLKGLIDHLRNSSTSKPLRMILAKIKSLNLKTKIVVGNPEGPMALESPAFRSWFGKSVVRDGSTSNPKVVYTGTSKDKDFTKFNIPRNGAWFTESSSDASQYAVENDSMGFKWENGRPVQTNTASRVMPVYLRIEKPYRLTDEEYNRLTKAPNYKKAQSDIFDSIRARGFDGIDWGNGIWVVLKEPNQVKSAIGNIGTYDPSKADMRYAENKAGSYDPATNTITIDPNLGMKS